MTDYERYVNCTQCSALIDTDVDNHVNFGAEEFAEIGILEAVCAICIIAAYRELDGLLKASKS